MAQNNNNPSGDNCRRIFEDGGLNEPPKRRDWRCGRCQARSMERAAYVEHMLDEHGVDFRRSA